MRVNLQLEMTDEQRQLFASQLAGKEVKRLATRDDVRNFMFGCYDGLLQSLHKTESFREAEVQPGLPPNFDISGTNGDPALEGKDPSFCRGYNKVKYRKYLNAFSS